MSVLKAIEAEHEPKPRELPADTQQVCIDLPGEDVKCVVYKPKLEIMLRKHRDVIFEIQLFKGMTYTVEADQSDFYNARDKKIVLKRSKQTVSFKDGERLHLWVGRDFRGSLILKANKEVLGRYQPNELDPVIYDLDPKIKPAPLAITLKNQESLAQIPSSTRTASSKAPFTNDWTINPVTRVYALEDWAPFHRSKPMAFAASSFKATTTAIIGTFKKNALVSFIFGSITSWAEWKSDTQKDGYDLAASLITSAVKAIIVAALASALTALILMGVMALAKAAVAALVIGALVLIANFAFNYIVEAADKAAGRALKGKENSDGTAAAIAPILRSAGCWVNEVWKELSRKFPKDYPFWAPT
jgi:hypothetical protein